MIALNSLHQADYLDLLRSLPDKSVDLLLTDPPYNSTNLHFDKSIVDYPAFFKEAWRVLKSKDSACILFAGNGLEADLEVNWRRKGFRYKMVWVKSMATGFLDASRRPLRSHEYILLFGRTTPRYFPQFEVGKPYSIILSGKASQYGGHMRVPTINDGKRYPRDVLFFSNGHGGKSPHPTAKPVDLLAHLIQTYSLPGEVVLDPFAGAGSTGKACQMTGRHYILGERHAPYIEVASKRLAEPAQMVMGLAA